MTTVLNEDGKPVQHGIDGIGDRVGVTDMRIDNGVIYIVTMDYRWAYEYQYAFQLVDDELVKTKISEEFVGYERMREY